MLGSPMMSANDQNDHFLDSDHDDDRDDDRDDDHASHQSAGAKWPQPQQELGIAGPSGTLTLNSALLMSELPQLISSTNTININTLTPVSIFVNRQLRALNCCKSTQTPQRVQ